MALAHTPNAYGGAGPFAMGLTWTLASIATILVAGRTYVAYRQFERLGWDVVWALITYVRRPRSDIR